MAKNQKARRSRAKRVRDLGVSRNTSAKVRGGGLSSLVKVSEAKAQAANQDLQGLAAQQAQLLAGRTGPSRLLPISDPAQ